MSWRDVLSVHEAADLFPMMSDDELKVLGEDIRKHGLLEQVVLWCEGKREFLLDGRNRLEAAERANLLAEDEYGRLCLRTSDGLREIRFHHTDDLPSNIYKRDPCALALSLNIHRRHLTAEQKRELIAKVLKAKPETSNRQIAEQIKASPTTVGAVRRELESTDQLGQLEKTTGKDGKERTTTPKRRRGPAGYRAAIARALAMPDDVTDRQRAERFGVSVQAIKDARKEARKEAREEVSAAALSREDPEPAADPTPAASVREEDRTDENVPAFLRRDREPSPPDAVNDLQRVMGHGVDMVFGNVPIILKRVLEDSLWAEKADKNGKPFASFKAFVTHRLWQGLESNIDDLLLFCRKYPDVQKLILAEVADDAAPEPEPSPEPELAPAPRRRGRPPGSKNKPKDAAS